MIAHVRGRVAHRGTDHVVVDVQGVGYLVHVATPDGVPARGQDVELHTSLQVREDSMTLYGFADRSALEVFELLLTASGIGPKIALAALRTHRADVMRMALATGDLSTLTAVPGIGRKGAERLVLELREKVGLGFDVAPDALMVSANGAPTPLAEAREALTALGYGAGEVQAAMAGVDSDGSTQDVLRQALRRLGSASAGR